MKRTTTSVLRAVGLAALVFLAVIAWLVFVPLATLCSDPGEPRSTRSRRKAAPGRNLRGGPVTIG